MPLQQEKPSFIILLLIWDLNSGVKTVYKTASTLATLYHQNHKTKNSNNPPLLTNHMT